MITPIEPGSAAEVGLKPKDEIISINLKPVAEMSVEEIDGLFKSQYGRGLLLIVKSPTTYYQEQIILVLKKRI